MVTHGFHPPEELTWLRTQHSSGVSAEEIASPPRTSANRCHAPAPALIERTQS